jgi:hypothetical protein
MPGLPTPILGLVVPTVGGDIGTWGGELNGDLAIIDNLGVVQRINISASTPAVVGVSPETVIRVTTGAIVVTFTLLPAAQCSGRIWTIKKVDSGVGQVSIVTADSSLIDAFASWTIVNQFAYVRVMSNGVSYDVIGNT